LQEVVVKGIHNPKPESKHLNRMPITYMEDIQSYSVATKETMLEIGATDFQSALRAVPGAGAATNDAYGYASLYLRGFRTMPTFRNGIYGLTHGGGDPQNLERIEVLRGPAGIFFNSNSSWVSTYGGIVNKVTKTAFDGKLLEIGGSYGSYNLTRLTADINIPLNDKVYLRVNGVYQIDPIWQSPHIFRKDILFAPVLVYKVNDKLDIKIEGEFNSNYIPQTFYFGNDGLDLSTPRNIRDLKLDYNTNYADPSFTYAKPNTQNFFAVKANYAVSNDWKLSFDFQRTIMNHYTGSIFPFFINDSQMARSWYDYDYKGQINAAQVNLNGCFKTASIKHKLLSGISGQYQYDASNGKLNGWGFPYADTLDLNTGAVPILDANALRSSSDASIFYGRSQVYIGSVYLADQMDFSDRFHIMLSLGLNWLKDPLGGWADYGTPNFKAKSFEQTSLNPRVGLVYEIVKGKASVFGNYTSASNQVPPTPLQSFKPEFSTQMEGGVKFDINHKITSTISYYHINISNTLRQDPTNNLLRIQDATRLSEGVDAEIVGTLFDGFKVIAGYGYNNSKFTESDENIKGKRPAGTAFHNANLWATYTIQSGDFKGLGFGFGGNHLGESYFNDVNTLVIPAYTILNSNVFYNVDKLRLGLNINNMSNQKYWNYAGLAQKPVNVLLSLNIKI
jgi:iron complex outermembrane recepter protein